MRSRQAHAKINLGLHVLRRRADGYHDIETVFLPIEWSDTVTVEPEETLSFTCDDDAIAGNDNLCMKAARALREAAGTKKGARIHLAKRIPYGAGLGGGSSDAAVTLRLLRDQWDPDGKVDLRAVAGTLGSDVPFFLQDEPAYATGRGEKLFPIAPEGDAWVFPFQIVVTVPETRISTVDAYRAMRPSEENRPDLRELVRSNDPQRWRRELVNDFEASIFDAFPEIESLKEAMYDAGAVYASMSGSGSAVYGIFDDAALASAAAEVARGTGHTTWRGTA